MSDGKSVSHWAALILTTPLLFGAGFGAGRAQTAASDASMERSVRQSFVFHRFLRKDKIGVKVSGGVVTLTGAVPDRFHQLLAEEAAKAQPGVVNVDDRLVVKKQPPIQLSDSWIDAKIKTLLLVHRGVSARGTKVSVKDGVVTLRGRAESLAQKDLTSEYAKDVDGVKGVKNEMRVAGSSRPPSAEEPVDDASVTALVKAALLFHRSTSALNTTVTTSSGTVTLGGTARDAAEKDLTTRIAKDVWGVKDVNNLMNVPGP